MLITVFTPTYNRAHLLKDLYLSLCAQTYHDFEWVIVDDGSTDETSQTVEAFQQDHQLLINYYYKPNGGKHTAINYGVQKAKGELFMIVDSDDALPVNALQIVAEEYAKVSTMKQLAGVAGYMAHRDGTWIGKPISSQGLIVSAIDFRYRLRITGDMMEVFRTNVLREFPFPEIPNERFCPEVLVWFRIARKYPLYYFKKVIYYRDYLEGGLTDNIIRIRMKSPQASTMCYRELLQYPLPFWDKLRAAINYWRFWFCLKPELKKKNKTQLPIYWKIICPLGWFMHLRDQYKVR